MILASQSPRRRELLEEAGFSLEVWREMAALGFVGMAIPEERGGAGLGFAELGLVLEEMDLCRDARRREPRGVFRHDPGAARPDPAKCSRGGDFR